MSWINCSKKSSLDESYKNIFDEPPQEKGLSRKALIGSGSAGIALVIIGGLLTAYFLSPAAHSWTNAHIFTPLTSQQMTVGQGLLMIGLPVGGFFTALAIAIYARHKSMEKKPYAPRIKLPNLDTAGENRCANERNKRVMKAAAALVLMTILAVGLYLAYHHFPAIQNGFHTALNHKMALWQNMAYIGTPVFVGGLAVSIALMVYQNHKHKKQEDIWQR